MANLADKIASDAGYGGTGLFSNVSHSNVNSALIGTKTTLPKQNFVQNLAGSIGRGIAAVPGMVGNSVLDSYKIIEGAGKAINQGVWGVRERQAELDRHLKAMTALGDMYKQKFKQGKMTKEQYKRALSGLQKEHVKGSKQAAEAASDIMSPQEAAKNLIMTGLMPFTFGRLNGIGVGGKAAEMAEAIPGVQKAIKATELAQKGKSAAQQAGIAALKALPKQEFVYKPTVESTVNIPTDLSKGNYMQAAGEAALLSTPLLFSAGSKVAGAIGRGASKLFKNTSGLFDNIQIKGGSINKVLQGIKTKDPEKAKQLDDILRVAQDNILKQYKGDRKAAATAFSEYVGSKNLSKMSLDKITLELSNLAGGTGKYQRLAKNISKRGGMIVDADGKQVTSQEIGRIGALKSTQAEKAKVVKAIVESKNAGEARAAIGVFFKENPRFAANAQNRRILEDISDSRQWGKQAAEQVKRSLKGTNEIFVRDAKGNIRPFPQVANGYYAGMRPLGAANFNPVGRTAALETGHKALLGGFGDALRKTGVSPEEVSMPSQRQAFGRVKQNLISQVDDMGLNGNRIYSTLNDLADSKLGVVDLRQLSWRQIQRATDVTDAQARAIRRATRTAYGELSLAERGLAGKITDANFRYNPLAAPYSRVQAVGRYELNPFFRLQENIETASGLKAMGGKLAKPFSDHTQTVKLLKDKGVLRGGYASEGAWGDIGEFSGLKARLSRWQERNIATTIEDFAGGKDRVAGWIANPANDAILNDIKTVVQYPDRGFTTSNLAKMINLVSFPMRYNIKVTSFAVKQLAKQPGMVQLGVARGLKDFNDFIGTPEGKQWQADNKEAIGLFKYFTPIQPIQAVFNALTGKDKDIFNLGLIGGLPFGVITRVLQGQGVLPRQAPYVDPRTGKTSTVKIPEDGKARAQQALTDIIDTLYTYPGVIAGMPPKKEISGDAANIVSLNQLKDGSFKTIERESEGQSNSSAPPNLGKINVPARFNQWPDLQYPQIQPIYKNKSGGGSKGKKPKTLAKPIGAAF